MQFFTFHLSFVCHSIVRLFWTAICLHWGIFCRLAWALEWSKVLQKATSLSFMNHVKCVRNVFLCIHTHIIVCVCFNDNLYRWRIGRLATEFATHHKYMHRLLWCTDKCFFGPFFITILCSSVCIWISFFPFLLKWIQRNFSFASSYQAYARAQRIYEWSVEQLCSLHAVENRLCY